MASTGILLALFVPVLNPATMSSFATYLIGYFIFVIGLAVGAYLLHVQTQWIGVGALILIGIGILSATQRTKPRDPPS
jgi:hypothetical protein